jgi:C4-dicarboxylate transporter, DctQ subunit
MSHVMTPVAAVSPEPAAARTMHPLRRALMATERRTTALAAMAAQVLLCLAVLSGLWQVFVRFVFNAPSEWSEVLTRFSLIWMVYLGVTLAVRQGAMVSIDLLFRLSRGHWRMGLELFITLATVALMATLAWNGVQVAWRIRFQEVAGLGFSMSWAYLAIPVGALFAIVAVIAHFFDPKRNELDTAA